MYSVVREEYLNEVPAPLQIPISPFKIYYVQTNTYCCLTAERHLYGDSVALFLTPSCMTSVIPAFRLTAFL